MHVCEAYEKQSAVKPVAQRDTLEISLAAKGHFIFLFFFFLVNTHLFK